MNSESTVFLVDDDPDALKSLSWLVTSVGLRVETFASAAEFLEAYDPTRPGCLVLDVRMPGMSGLELQDALAEKGIALPIIFVTAHGDVPMSARAFKAGAADFMNKPVNDQELLDSIQAAILRDQQDRRRQAERPDVAARITLLTPREREVMDLLAAGKSMKQISNQLGVSTQTSSKHRSRVLEKMQVDNEVALVRLLLSTETDRASNG